MLLSLTEYPERSKSFLVSCFWKPSYFPIIFKFVVSQGTSIALFEELVNCSNYGLFGFYSWE